MSDSLIPSTNPYFAVRSTFNNCVDKRGALSLIHDAEPWIVGAMSKRRRMGTWGGRMTANTLNCFCRVKRGHVDVCRPQRSAFKLRELRGP